MKGVWLSMLLIIMLLFSYSLNDYVYTKLCLKMRTRTPHPHLVNKSILFKCLFFVFFFLFTESQYQCLLIFLEVNYRTNSWYRNLCLNIPFVFSKELNKFHLIYITLEKFTCKCNFKSLSA